MEKVNLNSLQGHALTLSTELLKGILKVLTDMHCKNMSDTERSKYIADLQEDMSALHDALIESSRPGDSE